MNTKIIVALVIAFAVIGLTGAASAYSTYGNWIDTNTEITGTHWTSEWENIKATAISNFCILL